MIQATPSNYWVSSTAINLSLNAMGNSEYAQCSISTGATILVFIKDVIEYDDAHNYKRWTLSARPTAFGTTSAKYLYVSIPRSRNFENQNASIVFPSELIDIYGKNESGIQVGSTDYYYIYLQAKISASIDAQGRNQQRYFESAINTGTLSSDEALAGGPIDSEWYEYSSVSRIVTFIANATMKTGKKFINLVADTFEATSATISNLTLGGGLLNGVATTATPISSADKILTPSAASQHFLKKNEDDTAFGNMTFDKDITVNGTSNLKDTKLDGLVGSKDFTTGLLGNGWRIDSDGSAEMDSMSIRKFLEVPELRYNRTTVFTGVQWHTVGAGLIEEVTIDKDETTLENLPSGIIKLKLEDGEYGAIVQGDICMGIYHNESDNETVDSDTRDGDFKMKGFQTVYFKIDYICDENGDMDNPDSRNQYFHYTLRERTTKWTSQHHPSQSMSFACYAHPSNQARQCSIYSTTEYSIMLVGMTGWNYGGSNISMIEGNLNGFTIPASKMENGVWVDYNMDLEGYGIAFGNAYMWGSIKQFSRSRYLVSQQILYYGTSMNPAEVESAWSAKTLTIDDFTESTIDPRDYDYVYSAWKYTYSDSSTPVVSDPQCISQPSGNVSLDVNVDIVSIPVKNGKVASQSSTSVTPKVLFNNEEQTISSLTYTVTPATDAVSILKYNNVLFVRARAAYEVGKEWGSDKLLNITAVTSINGKSVTLTKSVNIIGNVQASSSTNLQLSTNTVVFPTNNGTIATGAVTRNVRATIYYGSNPATTEISSYTIDSSDGLSITTSGAVLTIAPTEGATWSNDRTLTINAKATVDGEEIELSQDVNVVGSAQGQTVQGPKGTSVRSIVEQYQATATQDASTLLDSQWSNQHINPTPSMPYIWNREKVTFENPSSEEVTEAHLCCTFADGMESHKSWYAVTSSNTAPSDASFDAYKENVSAAIAAMDAVTNRYLWNWEVTNYKDSSKDSSIKRLVTIWGEKGNTGDPGADGDKGNLFGYDNYITGGQIVHTKTGYATKQSNDSLYQLQQVIRKDANQLSKFEAGTYAISCKVKVTNMSGITQQFTIGCGADNAVKTGGNWSVDGRTNNCSCGNAYSLSYKFSIATEQYLWILVKLQSAGTGIVEVTDLKIEKADDLNGVCTSFTGLAPDSITNGQNIILGSNFADRSRWSLFNGSKVDGMYQGVDGFKWNGVAAVGNNNMLEQSLNGKLKPSTWYTLSYWCKLETSASNLSVYSFIYPNVSVASEISVQDGTIVSVNTDTRHAISASDSLSAWKRHTITFKTSSSLTTTTAYSVLWRVVNDGSATASASFYLCMPKLEECERVTDWQAAEADRKGDPGADAIQPNLYGYDCTLTANTDASTNSLIHTPIGFACSVSSTLSSTYFYVGVDMTGKMSAGRKYCIQGIVTSPLAGPFYVALRRSNWSWITSSNTTVNKDQSKSFKFVFTPAENVSSLCFEVSVLGNTTAFDGVFNIGNLKVEDITDINGESTPFDVVSDMEFPIADNLFDSTKYYNGDWSKASGTTIVKNGFESSSVVAIPISSGSSWTVSALSYNKTLDANKTYVMSWYEKASVSGITNNPEIIISDKSSGRNVSYSDVSGVSVACPNRNPQASYTMGTVWVQHYIVFRSVGNSRATLRFSFKGTGTAYFSRLKLEYGEYPTVYMESPEDRKGLDGCVIRTRGEWDKNTVYVNESDLDEEEIRYIDVVQYKNGESLDFYQRNSYSTGYTAGILPTNTTYWTRANMMDFVASKVLMTEEAWAETLTGKSLLVTDKDSNVVAGMQSVKDEETPQIFAGASRSDAHQANFRVYPNGHVVLNDVDVDSADNNGNRLQIGDGSIQIVDSNGNVLTTMSQFSPSTVDKSMTTHTTQYDYATTTAVIENGPDTAYISADSSLHTETYYAVNPVATLTAAAEGGFLTIPSMSMTITRFSNPASTDDFDDGMMNTRVELLVNGKVICYQNIESISILDQAKTSSIVTSLPSKTMPAIVDQVYEVSVRAVTDYMLLYHDITSGTYNLPNNYTKIQLASAYAVSISYDNYLNKILGNGFVFSKSSNRYFSYVNDVNISQETMRFCQGQYLARVKNQMLQFNLNGGSSFYNANPLVFAGYYNVPSNIISERTAMYNPYGLTLRSGTSSIDGSICDNSSANGGTYTFYHRLAQGTNNYMVSVTCHSTVHKTAVVASKSAGVFVIKTYNSSGSVSAPAGLEIMIYDCSTYN